MFYLALSSQFWKFILILLRKFSLYHRFRTLLLRFLFSIFSFYFLFTWLLIAWKQNFIRQNNIFFFFFLTFFSYFVRFIFQYVIKFLLASFRSFNLFRLHLLLSFFFSTARFSFDRETNVKRTILFTSLVSFNHFHFPISPFFFPQYFSFTFFKLFNSTIFHLKSNSFEESAIFFFLSYFFSPPLLSSSSASFHSAFSLLPTPYPLPSFSKPVFITFLCLFFFFFNFNLFINSLLLDPFSLNPIISLSPIFHRFLIFLYSFYFL